ncbi:MAG: potassium channel protein [Deinococcales bacterium]
MTPVPSRRPTEWARFLVSVRYPLALFAAVVLLGTAAFHTVWSRFHASWMDALYMTFITVTTVGYSELYPLGTIGRAVAIVVAVAGIGSLFYLLAAVMEFLVAQQVRDPLGRRSMRQRIAALNGHVVVIGYGRMGRRSAEELAHERIPYVVVDSDPAVGSLLQEAGVPFVIGEGDEEEVLLEAGLERARGLIVATNSDATNAFVVMTARSMNAALTIVARADDAAAVRKLERAGADRAIDLYTLGGRRLANTVVRPATVDFLHGTLRERRGELAIEEEPVAEGSELAGHTLRQLDLRQRTGASVLAVFRGNDTHPNPESEFVLQAGDRLLVMATVEQISALRRLTRP